MNMKDTNPFNIYTSKVKRFRIPLPSFEYFHRASSEEKVDDKFIGRERNSKRLYAWLSEEKTQSGSYLVTGYRGMGKSSFVGRILYELSDQPSGWRVAWGYLAFALIWAGGILLMVAEYLNQGTDTVLKTAAIAGILIGLIIVCGIFNRHTLYYRWRRLWFAVQVARKRGNIVKVYRKVKNNWEGINKELYNTNISKKSPKRICISINLGQEILNEKDVLSLVAHQLYTKYNSYIHSMIANCLHWLLHWVITLCLTKAVMHIALMKWSCLEMESDGVVLAGGCLCFMAVYGILHFVRSRSRYSQEGKLRRLKFLKERIEAQISLEKSGQVEVKGPEDWTDMGFGVKHSRKISKRFPFADTREMEKEMVDILEMINQEWKGPQFIFVFDELDKIESDNRQPFNDLEFTSEKHFPGGGTSRRRKQNVLHLLANMKLFISTAKAKFIFIAGRELYDAYLADLSDREFAISSIFNGVIYVESFCSNERREKDIMSNAETYICKQLIPKCYIRKMCIRNFMKSMDENRPFNRLDVNLKMYYRFLMESYQDFLSEKGKRATEIPQDVRDCADKAVILLYHFSVYLYHISNGSPKKMSLYFEKYIRSERSDKMLTLDRWDRTKSMLDNKDMSIYIRQKAKYHLSFGYIDQRTIGFVHYIAFPVTQIIINANQFGDKLLVSASFLINHIYKFHKGGFSWRNIEHTPELLEVYRIPEFRSFINSILSYLTQSHIIPITCGLYQFKFRKQFSEEISLASKFSEEIAALFNFTLDESLSVKQHYRNLLEDYGRMKEKEGYDNPHVMAGIHIILADLLMADEEYTKAILEYQTAIKIIVEDEGRNHDRYRDRNDQHAITRILFLIRNMLKLGLAFEKRKTFESAYATYNELIGRLIDFRFLDEEEIGLNYAIKKENNEHEAVLFSAGIAPQRTTLKKRVCPSINNEIDRERLNTAYSVNGSDIIVDFAHQMTCEKNLIIQRLAMLEDIRIIYQAILAKLFVLEKIELGGITRANIELLESEYVFLHLATNEKNKFLISNDFFRRLGDIMFYKNGLTRDFYWDAKNERSIDNSFMEGMYLWSYNVRKEILDFCNENNCYHLKDRLIDTMYSIKDDDMEKVVTENTTNIEDILRDIIGKHIISDNMKDRMLIGKFVSCTAKLMNDFPLKKVLNCNKHRQMMWKDKRHLPCFACKYYNKSLRLLMKNLFDVNIDKACQANNCSKVFVILHELVTLHNSKSLRQNFMIQLAEVLDCMGNVMLSCTANTDQEQGNEYKCEITSAFLADFLTDMYTYNRKDMAENKPSVNMELLKNYYHNTKQKDITMLEKSLMFYWEAYMCFRTGNEFKKAAGSLKKIMHTLQKYVRIDNKGDGKELIGQHLNEIKDRIIKQCLINIYAYYNYINIIEIQKIKWIFNVQMYESISLNRLSMFPDIEEVMLIYYDLLANCADYGTDDMKRDFRIKLAGIYKNSALGTFRLESTLYERVISLQFKTTMNQLILNKLFTEFGKKTIPDYYATGFPEDIIKFLGDYMAEANKLNDKLGEYGYCFKSVLESSKGNDNTVHLALSLLEFLIKDSMYCLTRILEIITPYTSTTLFTNTFLADIYQRLYQWNQLFDVLYIIYLAAETGPFVEKDKTKTENDKTEMTELRNDENNILWETGFHNNCPRLKSENQTMEKEKATCAYLECVSKNNMNTNTSSGKCPYYDIKCKFKYYPLEEIASKMEKDLYKKLKSYQKLKGRKIAGMFFNEILQEIGKSNIHYTLSNYSVEMALKCYRDALDMHREGKSYKEMINKMYYLDDDLKNDTIQFDLALERLRINNGYIDMNIMKILGVFKNTSIYDVENFCTDNETKLSLDKRFMPKSTDILKKTAKFVRNEKQSVLQDKKQKAMVFIKKKYMFSDYFSYL